MTIRTRVAQRRVGGAAEEAAGSVMVAALHLEQALAEVCERHGITGDQYNVLRILRGVHPGGHSRAEVGMRMIRRSPDVTRMLDRLERQGLVRRSRDGSDRRLSIATITPTGIRLLKRMKPELANVHQAATGSLSDAQLRRLARLCNALVP